VLDLSGSIVRLGENVGSTLENAAGMSDYGLYVKFRQYGRTMRRYEQRSRRMRHQAPDELIGPHIALRTALTPVASVATCR
jgi:hypothetical protein